MATLLFLVLFSLAILCTDFCRAAFASSPQLKDAQAAVIVPGYLTGASDFLPLAKTLTKRGIPTVVVPMPVWAWYPCTGGRSMRPILEKLEYTVKHVSSCLTEGREIHVPPYQYSLLDCWHDFWDNPGGVYKVGGSDKVDEFPTDVQPRGSYPPPASPPERRICLIGHSAGGFISRVYLSNRSYGGKVYNGQELVHSLVTLGTPQKDTPGAAFENVKWINQEKLPVRGLAICGCGFPGNSTGWFTKGSYDFCVGAESCGSKLDGDGVTTVESAMALDGDNVEKRVFENVLHYPWADAGFLASLVAPELTKLSKQGTPWYGDEEIVDKWVDFLLK
jgi:hypothetical protein